jgi:hypothetical protein
MTDESVGKSFLVIFTNGDLPSNPMSLRECSVCGDVFTQDQTVAHYYAHCDLSPDRSLAAIAVRACADHIQIVPEGAIRRQGRNV